MSWVGVGRVCVVPKYAKFSLWNPADRVASRKKAGEFAATQENKYAMFCNIILNCIITHYVVYKDIR